MVTVILMRLPWRMVVRGKDRMAPVDPPGAVRYRCLMNAVEFVTGLKGAAVLDIPSDIAAHLPRAGKARVIVLTEEPTDDDEWRSAAYEQFLRDDPPADAIYDSMR